MASSPSPGTSVTVEDDFMRVLDEMNQLCGAPESTPTTSNENAATNNNKNEQDHSFLNSSSPHQLLSNDQDSSDPIFEDVFAPKSLSTTPSATSTTLASGVSNAPLIGDQLLSSVASGSMSKRRTGSVSGGGGLNRSRHCSANSAKSCVSFDSAIGDVYSVQTPNISSNHSSNQNSSSFDLDRDLFDLTPTTSSSAENSPSLNMNSSSSKAKASAGAQFDHLAASVCCENMDFDTSKDVEGLGGISLRLVGSEEVDLGGGANGHGFSLEVPTSIDSNSNITIETISSHKRHGSLDEDIEGAKRARLQIPPSSANSCVAASQKSLRFHQTSPLSSSSTAPQHSTLTNLSPQMIIQRRDVERICLDLLKRFQHACSLHPKTQAKVWMSKSGEDPLLVTTRLLSDSLTRLRVFVNALDPMEWLAYYDRNVLYGNNVCTLSVFKAAVSVNLETVPPAYPLPYGEYLGEVEALHLILAHDLYNELRSLLSHIQGLGIREFPVMLLVMMVAFFSPQPNLKQPDKVVRVNDYYSHKLQVM